MSSDTTLDIVQTAITLDIQGAVLNAGTGAVTSWNTRTGAVVPASGDYTAAQITETATAKIMTATERAAIARINWQQTEYDAGTTTDGDIEIDVSNGYNQKVTITTTDASLLLADVSNLGTTYPQLRLEVTQNGGEIDDVTGWTVDDNFDVADFAGASVVILLATYSNSISRLAIESIEA